MDSILFAVILLPKSSHKVQTVLFFVKNSLHFEQVTRSIQKIWWTHLILYLLKDKTIYKFNLSLVRRKYLQTSIYTPIYTVYLVFINS